VTISPIRRAAVKSARAPIRCSFNQLVPLRERPTRRQVGWILADQHRLHRIAAPGHRANAFGAKPDKVLAGRARHGSGQDAARHCDERFEVRVVESERYGGYHGGPRLGVEPRPDFSNLL
jgi:hypothetical protein